MKSKIVQSSELTKGLAAHPYVSEPEITVAIFVRSRILNRRDRFSSTGKTRKSAIIFTQEQTKSILAAHSTDLAGAKDLVHDIVHDIINSICLALPGGLRSRNRLEAVKAQRTTELLHAVRGVLALTEHGFCTYCSSPDDAHEEECPYGRLLAAVEAIAEPS